MKESASKAYKNNDVLKNELSAAYHILRVQPDRKYSRRRRLTDLTWLLVIVWWHIRQHPHFPPFQLTSVVSGCQSFGMQKLRTVKKDAVVKAWTQPILGWSAAIKTPLRQTLYGDVCFWRCSIDSRRLKKKTQIQKVWIYKETWAVWEDMKRLRAYKS